MRKGSAEKERGVVHSHGHTYRGWVTFILGPDDTLRRQLDIPHSQGDYVPNGGTKFISLPLSQEITKTIYCKIFQNSKPLAQPHFSARLSPKRWSTAIKVQGHSLLY